MPITASLSDPDGSFPATVSWQWARSVQPVRLDRTLRYRQQCLHTAPLRLTDDQGNYYLRATASYDDGHGSGKSAEAVTAQVAAAPPTNAKPVFPDAEDGRREVPENSPVNTLVGEPVAATDFDNDTLTYSMSGSDSGSFTIGSNDGQLSLAQGAELDYESKRTYSFSVRATDGQDDDGNPNTANDDTITVTVTLIDVNEAPVVTGTQDRNFSENGTGSIGKYTARDPEGDPVTWSVAGDDGGSFVITDRGSLYFRQPPDFEDPQDLGEDNVYNMEVVATDEGGLEGRQAVTVTVTDVEEPGTLIILPDKGWYDTTSVPPAVTRFEAILVDDDCTDCMPTWQWQRSSSENIPGETTEYYTASELDVDRTLRLTATYRNSPQEKTLTTGLSQAIGNTRPTANTAPEFPEPLHLIPNLGRYESRTITSSPSANRNIGSPVRANDDENDRLTYMLRGRDADKFRIDPRTGQLRTWVVLDHEVEDTYTVSVSVHDGFDAYYRPSRSVDDTVAVIITVVPPPPRLIIIDDNDDDDIEPTPEPTATPTPKPARNRPRCRNPPPRPRRRRRPHRCLRRRQHRCPRRRQHRRPRQRQHRRPRQRQHRRRRLRRLLRRRRPLRQCRQRRPRPRLDRHWCRRQSQLRRRCRRPRRVRRPPRRPRQPQLPCQRRVPRRRRPLPGRRCRRGRCLFRPRSHPGCRSRGYR